MRVYKYIHSCLLLEEGDDKLLFDPGYFSFVEDEVRPETFKGVSVVVITHQHPDHIYLPALKKILEHNQAMVITNAEGKAALAKEHIGAVVLEEGTYQTKNFTLRAMSAAHEAILSPTLPQNTAYLVNEALLNPGDSFTPQLSTLQGISALALPVMAPWTTELAVAEFAKMMAPRMVIPVHDGYVKEFFLKQRYDNYEKYFAPLGITFQHMGKPGDVVEIKEH